MTPPPAATVAGRTPQVTPRPRSRAARPAQRPATRPAARPARRERARITSAVALPRVAVPRLPRISLREISAALPLGRLVGGRGAIVTLGVMLLGLVFLQVSLLKLNTAISVNVERSAQLERDNAQARAIVSKLDAGRRIQDAAGKLDMVMPAAGSICFLKAARYGPCAGGDIAQAGSGLDPTADLAPAAGSVAATATQPPAAGTIAPATTTPGITAPAAGTPAAGTPAATAPAGATTQAQATAPSTTTPAQTAPAQTGASPTQTTAPPAGTAPAQGVPASGTTGGLQAGG